MSTHKAYIVQEPFGLDSLTLIERSVPQPGAGQVHFGKVCVRMN